MPTEKSIDKVLSFQRQLFLSKLADYGTEDMTEVGAIGVANRIKEKATRAIHLLSNKETMQTPKNESIWDTFQDIMGYGMIGALIETGEWEGEGIGLGIEAQKKSSAGKILIQREGNATLFPLPFPQKKGDVGFDLFTLEEATIPAHNQFPVDVGTGIHVKLPEGTFAIVINRSSTPRKMGIEVVPGIIDNGYTGELFACCFNRTDKDIIVLPGTRLAQFIVLNSNVPGMEEVTELPITERGQDGFGSTGE